MTSTSDDKKSPSKKKIDTFLQFAFQMDSIVLNLYTAPNEGLAYFGIHFLSLKGCKLVDESMSASVVLCDVQLDDIRPDREKFITRFMKKKEIETSNSANASHSMVDIVVRIKQDDTFANLKVNSFDLILSLEFLLKLAQFVSVPEESATKSIPTSTNTNVMAKREWIEPDNKKQMIN